MQPVTRFKEYPSIELSTRQNFVKRLQEGGFTKPDILWIASEKIHGCNFSVFCDGTNVKYGRRNDFITKDIPVGETKVDNYFLESFYDARNLVLEFHNKLGDLFKDLAEQHAGLRNFTLYGEYFGGNWPTKQAKQKAVQTGICYSPKHHFFVFDVLLRLDGDVEHWVEATGIQAAVGKYLRVVPIYAQGNFEQVYAIETKIDSTVPELLGLQKIVPNLIEGMVLRPDKTIYLGDQRVILKKKNAQFAEKTPTPVAEKKKKQEKELPAEVAGPVEAYQQYLNKNRIESVLSKFPALKDRNQLKTKIVEDMVSDAAKDGVVKPEGDLLKKVMQEVDKKVLKALNEYLATH